MGPGLTAHFGTWSLVCTEQPAPWTREAGKRLGCPRGTQNIPPALTEGPRRLLVVIRRGNVKRVRVEAQNRGSDYMLHRRRGKVMLVQCSRPVQEQEVCPRSQTH